MKIGLFCQEITFISEFPGCYPHFSQEANEIFKGQICYLLLLISNPECVPFILQTIFKIIKNSVEGFVVTAEKSFSLNYFTAHTALTFKSLGLNVRLNFEARLRHAGTGKLSLSTQQ